MRYAKWAVVLVMALALASWAQQKLATQLHKANPVAQPNEKYVIWPEQTDASLTKEYARTFETFPISLDDLTLARVFNSPVTGKVRLAGAYYLVGPPAWEKSKAKASLFSRKAPVVELGDLKKDCLGSTFFTLSFKQPLPLSPGRKLTKEAPQYYRVPFSFVANLKKGNTYILVLQTLVRHKTGQYKEVSLILPMGSDSTLGPTIWEEKNGRLIGTGTSDTIYRAGVKKMIDVPQPRIPVALTLAEDK
jgi:hypothetical protein